MAASSTQHALEAVAEALRKSGGPNLTISPAGSNALAQQILAGAPADLFLSAHPEWVEEVDRHGKTAASVPLLTGDLVLVVPKRPAAADVATPRDLLDDGVRRVAMGDEHVPAGRYAEQALKALNLYETLATSGRLVRGPSVRFALAYVERGEVDAGIVYASDAAISPDVRVVHTFDAAVHEPIVYPLVLLKRGSQRDAARQAYAFLQSPEAAAIFESHGFHAVSTNEEAG